MYWYMTGLELSFLPIILAYNNTMTVCFGNTVYSKFHQRVLV